MSDFLVIGLASASILISLTSLYIQFVLIPRVERENRGIWREIREATE